MIKPWSCVSRGSDDVERKSQIRLHVNRKIKYTQTSWRKSEKTFAQTNFSSWIKSVRTYWTFCLYSLKPSSPIIVTAGLFQGEYWQQRLLDILGWSGIKLCFYKNSGSGIFVTTRAGVWSIYLLTFLILEL